MAQQDARTFKHVTRGLFGLAIVLLAVLLWSEGAAIVIAGIHVYRDAVAPVAARLGATCRFEPSCSRYAETVIRRDGVAVGGWKTLRRIVRCGPWTARGTRDDP
jgi:putative membrane protein insertion efficiency factor